MGVVGAAVRVTADGTKEAVVVAGIFAEVHRRRCDRVIRFQDKSADQHDGGLGQAERIAASQAMRLEELRTSPAFDAALLSSWRLGALLGQVAGEEEEAGMSMSRL